MIDILICLLLIPSIFILKIITKWAIEVSRLIKILQLDDVKQRIILRKKRLEISVDEVE